MRRSKVIMAVAPEFRSKLKIESAQNNMSIIEYTKKLASKQDESLKDEVFKKKKGGFDLSF